MGVQSFLVSADYVGENIPDVSTLSGTFINDSLRLL